MLILESHFADVVPDELQDCVPDDARVFGVVNAPLGQLVMAERRAGRTRVGVSVHGIDVDSTWLGTGSNRIHRLTSGGGVDGEVAGEPLHVRREPARIPWRSRHICLELGGRKYVLVRSRRKVTLLDDRGAIVATADERRRQLAPDRSGNEYLLAILCFAANLNEATRSPLAAVFV